MPSILVLSLSDLRKDPRVVRQIDWLASAGHTVLAAGLQAPDRCNVPFIQIYPDERGALFERVGRGLLLFARRHESVYWSVHATAWRALEAERPDLIIANDLETLPLAARLASKSGTQVVFDAHEYAPREFDQSWRWRRLRQPYATALCRSYMPSAARVTTVGPGIAQAYADLIGVRSVVITNAPDYHPELNPIATSPERIRLVHHGVATPSRKIESMIRLANFLDKRFELHFILVDGDPAYRERLRQIAASNSSIHFDPPVPMPAITGHLNQFDLGLFLLEPTNLNYKHALPNKFFEFIQARLGIAIGPSPDMAAIVRATGNGIVSTDFTPEALARELNRLSVDDVMRFKQASHTAAREHSAEGNRVKWLEVCERALGRPAH